jgi:predicted esterase
MRPQYLGTVLACALTSVSLQGTAFAEGPKESGSAKTSSASKRWCGPEVSELSDHVCFFDGGPRSDGRRTLVIYLHGMLALTPGFQYVQQSAMALHAKRHNFTVVIPTAPSDGNGRVWPTSQTAQKEQEPGILAGIKKARADVEKKVGHRFDETFVVGFSSGAYYASALAVRSALDVDGYIVLAGGSAWVRSEKPTGKRAPIFVGVSAADPQTAAHSRAFGGSLATMGWPVKVEERNAGHMVDWTFMAHGIAWLRAQKSSAPALESVSN